MNNRKKNIVPLGQQNPPPLPEPCAALQRHFLNQSKFLLEQFWSASEELFSVLAKNSSSSKEQALYRDALHAIRRKRQMLMLSSLNNLSANFTKAFHGKSLPQPEALSSCPADGQAPNVRLALSNISERSHHRFSQPLSFLACRLNQLLSPLTFGAGNNPYEPVNFCMAVMRAIEEQLAISPRAQLIIMKLLESNVLNKLEDALQEANQILAEHGILAELDHKLGKASGSPEQQSPGQLSGESAGNMLVTLDIDELIKLIDRFSHGAKDVQGLHLHDHLHNPGPAMNRAELLRFLAKSHDSVVRAHNRSGPRNLLPSLINRLLAIGTRQRPRSLQADEDNIVNLVAVFFDFVLDDENISPAVRLQISKLQIPILRCALRDEQFFSKPEHPARKLVETIAKAGIAMDDSKELSDDRIYQTISQSVEHINAMQDKENKIFKESLQRLRHEILEERKKTIRLERQVANTEKDKITLHTAKLHCRNFVIDAIKHKKMPVRIREFIIKLWFQVLVFCYLRYGPQSTELQNYKQLVNDLIWSSNPHNDPKARKRFMNMKNTLIKQINHGLSLTINDAEYRENFVKRIYSILLKAEHGTLAEKDYQEISESQALDLLAPSNEELETAIILQQRDYSELSEQYRHAANNIAEGTWLRYQLEGGKFLRCKLRKKLTDKVLLFTNRFGFKLMEKSVSDFAYDLQTGRAQPLDKTPLFQRFLQTLSEKLQSAQAAT